MGSVEVMTRSCPANSAALFSRSVFKSFLRAGLPVQYRLRERLESIECRIINGGTIIRKERERFIARSPAFFKVR